MKTIETDQVDAYVQKMCTDTSLTPEQRGQQAATAMHVHVMQEFGLTMGTRLPVDEEIVEHHEVFIDAKGDRLLDDIYEQAAAAWMALEAAYPEQESTGVLVLPPEMRADLDSVRTELAQGETRPPLVIVADPDEAVEQARMDRFMKGESE